MAHHRSEGPFRQLLLLSRLDATRIGETSALLKPMLMALVDRDRLLLDMVRLLALVLLNEQKFAEGGLGAKNFHLQAWYGAFDDGLASA